MCLSLFQPQRIAPWGEGRAVDMIKPESQLKTLKELHPNQRADFFAQLWKKDFRQTREGRPYTKVVFRDADREVSASIWENSQWDQPCREQWQPGGFYKIRGVYTVNLFGGGIKILKIRPVEEADHQHGFDPLLCQPTSKEPPEDIHEAILKLVAMEVAHEGLRQVVETLYERHRETLLLLPASLRHHHRYAGGYLQHVYSTTQMAIRVVDHYRDQHPALYESPLRDLVIAGCLLHDIGKLRELADPTQNGGQYTPAGQLLGHLIQGRDMVREVAAELALQGDWLLRLEHLILAHQGSPEHGSLKVPQTVEATLVHFVDQLDGTVFRLLEAVSEPSNGSPFTTTNNRLGQALYRGALEVPESSEPSA